MCTRQGEESGLWSRHPCTGVPRSYGAAFPGRIIAELQVYTRGEITWVNFPMLLWCFGALY